MFSLTAKQAVIDGVVQEAYRIAEEAATSISGDQNNIAAYEQLMIDPSTAALHKDSIDHVLSSIRLMYAESGVENAYTIMLIDDVLKIAGDPTDDSQLPLSVHDYAHLELKKNIFTNGQTVALDEPYIDDYGVWISAYAPITDPSKKVLAIIGVDLPLGAYTIIDKQVSRTLLYALIPGVLLSAFLSLLISRNLSGPIEDVIQGIEDVRAGHMMTRIVSTRRDELGEIGKAFNGMVVELEEKEKLKSTLHQAVSPSIAKKLITEDINPKGELMEGTVLFADIRGFTQLSETITARDTIEFINEFLRHSVPEIQNHGGIIEKFVGDEIFAVFGGPVPLDDDALQAVSAALKIQSKIEKLNIERRAHNIPEINVGIGICTGMMIGGIIGTESRNNYTLLGSTVNEGARISGLAEKGDIIISQSTFLRVQHHFNVDKLPPIQVKGKEFMIHTFSVNGKMTMA